MTTLKATIGKPSSLSKAIHQAKVDVASGKKFTIDWVLRAKKNRAKGSPWSLSSNSRWFANLNKKLALHRLIELEKMDIIML